MTYAAIAQMYDRLMVHVRYELWAGFIRDIIKRHGNGHSPSIFEIGGGTGNLGKILVDAGFSYRGSDYSRAMCRKAVDKGIPFIAADGRFLPIKARYDLIVFLYDGINYLLYLREYTALCREVFPRLLPGGLFLFDITTEANSRQHFMEYLDFEDFEDLAYIRHSYFDEQAHMQYNDFTVFERVDEETQLYKKHAEHHAQRVFEWGAIRQAIPADLFDIVGIWDGFTFRKAAGHSERIHFLLRRKEQA